MLRAGPAVQVAGDPASEEDQDGEAQKGQERIEEVMSEQDKKKDDEELILGGIVTKGKAVKALKYLVVAGLAWWAGKKWG